MAGKDNVSGITMAVFNEFKEGLNKRLDKTDDKIDKVDVKVDNLHDKVNGLELKLTEYRTETRQFRHEFDQNTKYRCHQHESVIAQLKDKQAIIDAKLNIEESRDKRWYDKYLGPILKKLPGKLIYRFLIIFSVLTAIVLIVLGIFAPDVLLSWFG